MSSLAQEESRNISENVTWGQRKRFADGKVSFAYSRFLGLDKDKKTGKIVINPEQAETVKLIYHLFLEGMTPHSIATELTSRGIKTPAGKDVWNQHTVRRILSNEKYKGDALLQKEFTVDFLQKKMKKNEGEVPQYYVEGNHEAIISPAVLVDMVQGYIAENARIAQDQAEYQKRYDGLVAKYDAAKTKYDETVAAITGKEYQSARLEAFIKALRKRDGAIEDFDESLWGSMVESVMVGRDKMMTVTFQDGTAVQA